MSRVRGPTARHSSGSLSPSDYSLLAEVPAVAGKPALYALANVTVSGAEPIKVVMNLQPSMIVIGKIAFEGQTLKPPPDLTRVRVSLFTHEGTPSSNTMQSTTDAAGAFTVVGVIPGQFRVNATVTTGAAPGGPAWTVKSVVADGRDVTDLPLTIVPGAAPTVTVTFTDQSAELAGALTLSDGKPATDYFVVLLPADRSYWTALSRRIASTRPDGTGRYVFRNLPAGSYRIAVTTDLVTRDLQDMAALDQLASRVRARDAGLRRKAHVRHQGRRLRRFPIPYSRRSDSTLVRSGTLGTEEPSGDGQ